MELKQFFAAHPRGAIAFSGGVDSAYLLYAALHYGADVRAYYVQSPFQPRFEYEDAQRLARELHADLKVIPVDVLAEEQVAQNPANRCYYCKQAIFGSILRQAAADGYTEVWDGTNASDDAGDRPGMKALRELEVLSPLRLCGLTKPQIRQNSKEAGLFTWNKPAYACLATRVPAGEPITRQKLAFVEKAEEQLFAWGFTDFRVRMPGTMARLQLPEEQMPLLLQKRTELLQLLKPYCTDVVLDLEAR